MIIFYDWRNANHCLVSYPSDIETAELQAIQIMDEIKHLLSSQSWQRCEWSSDVMEYAERPAIGTCRIYIRIIRDGTPRKCDKCKKPCTHQIRGGDFCDKHYAKYVQEYESD